MEELEKSVREEFEKKTGRKVKVAWPVGATSWQVQDESGMVWTLSW